ncbi:MAG: 30S ribosomal protein S20 [Anaerolineae bacterium]|nr:30S ribosomal protein S20 [Anaerolineae bacterium]
MANTKSALKRIRTTARKEMRNRAVRSATRTYVKKARTLMDAGEEAEAQAAVMQAISTLDRAVTKGVLHRNNAARRKSRLMQRFHSLEK